ncbi:tyrosine-type recombinase/integrase [Leifsonia sp. L25]|uniref:tyrosine-type recombinase/integrase n=1 Tax=Actinomycetes TaxID=1760 RepID=UPI003D694FB5
MGSIDAYESAKGRRYRVRWRDPEHQQREKRGFRTKREAELYNATVEVAMMKGTYFEASQSKITVGELAEEWLANKEQALKPSSFSPIRIAWRVYVEPRWATTPIGAIRPSAVEKWIRELSQGKAVTVRVRVGNAGKPRSAGVVLRAVGILAGILDVAVRDGRIPANPARGASNLPRKGTKKRRRYLTNEEVFRFARAVPDDKRSVLVLTLAYTGIRWGEAVALTVNDIDLDRCRLAIHQTATEVDGLIHVGPPKSWEARSVPFPAFLAPRFEQLIAAKKRDDLVFPARAGGYLARPDTAWNRQSWWLTALHDAGLEHMTPHDLKHTAASLAVSAGANVKALQRMLGHKSAAMTLDTYADLFEDDLGSVADRLNERVLSESGGSLWSN